VACSDDGSGDLGFSHGAQDNTVAAGVQFSGGAESSEMGPWKRSDRC
jgi:hypothetical protein